MQELDFKNMKLGVNIHRIVGHGKKLVENTKVLEKIERLQEQVQKIEIELEGPLNEIRIMETLNNIQKKINRFERKIRKIIKNHEKSFKALKKKRAELARIIDKKKIYRVDLELDQIMTCFKISDYKYRK